MVEHEFGLRPTEMQPDLCYNSIRASGGSMSESRSVANHFILFRDGELWCAAPPGFRNLALDPAGWGSTRDEAISNLCRDREFQARAREQKWPEPKIEDFLELLELGESTMRTISDEAAGPNFRAGLRRRAFKLISNS
jgi:hypothetical protein